MTPLSIHRQRYFRLFAAIGIVLVMALLLVASARAYATPTEVASRSGRHVLTIHDGVNEKGVFTEAETLGDALTEAGVVLDDNDVTEPRLDEKLVAPTYEVNIYRARPVVIIDGERRTKVLTPYQTAKQIAKQAGLELHDEDQTSLGVSDNIMRDGALQTLTIRRATPFTFVFYGKKTQSYTMAKTVGDMLAQKKIVLGANDTLSASLETPITAAMTVELWRNGKQTVTQEEEVAFPTRRIEDANQKVGYRKVETPGVKGTKLVTYDIEMKNGKELQRTAVKTVITKEPAEQVEVVGTKPSFSGDFAAALAKLRACEAGGNYANKRNPLYRGAYQFSYGTWGNKYGIYDPADATPAQQDQAARELYERRGWQPWPHCGASLPDTYR